MSHVAFDGLRFKSVRKVLGWYTSTREKVQNPKASSLPMDIDADGNPCVVAVDGGQGVSLEDVHCALLTVNAALNALREDNYRRFRVLVATRLEGQSQAQVARDMHMSEAWLSGEVGKAEAFIARELMEDMLR